MDDHLPPPPSPPPSSPPPPPTPSPLARLSATELRAEFHRLEHERRRLEAATAEAVAEVERRRAYRPDGHRTLTAWCRAEGGWSSAEAVARAQLARLVTRHPEVAVALRAGSLGVAQAHLLARAAANPRIGLRFGEVVSMLLVDAATLPFDDLRRVVEHWEHTLDVDGADRARHTGHAYRFARLHHASGRCELAAAGGALDGTALQEIFDRYCDAEFQTDLHHAREHGVDVDTDGLVALPRTARQRAFDALLRIFLDAAASGTATGDAEPVVDIVIDAGTLERAVAALGRGVSPGRTGIDPLSGADTTVFTRPAAPRRWHSRSRDGQWIHPHDVLLAALMGRVRRVVTDDAGVVIDLGRRQRLFTGGARDAVVALAIHCTWPGCRVHHRLCQADHTTAYRDGGTTDPRNGGLLCPHHNRWKQRGFRVWRDPSGEWHTYRPDGSEVGTP